MHAQALAFTEHDIHIEFGFSERLAFELLNYVGIVTCAAIIA